MRPISSAPAAIREGELAEAPSFAAVFRTHAPYVWRLLRRLGAAHADADDLCQEVFVVVHRRLPELDTARSLRPWIYGVAVRVASDHRRRQRVCDELNEQDDAPTPPAQHDAMESRRLRGLLDEAILRLEEPKRAIFVLHELEELNMAEIAEAVSCPLQTAYSRLHAARKEVKAFFARLDAKETRR
jgi:RNA polymerase sigma-70 factor (ECF subfamily)